jgi:hypothetical protein
MRAVFSSSVLGAICLTLFCSPTLAQAAPTPGPVTVRVEGTNATLLPPTVVATKPGSYKLFFGGGPSCSGTSAAEALDLAALTGGSSWGGTFNAGFQDFLVNSIGGELHPTGPTDGTYWSFWYDHAPAQMGICGQPLGSGDEILFFPDCFSPCPPGFVSPNVLGMTAPAVVQQGSPVGVAVTSYANADGAASAAGGATVSGGGVSATTAAGGAATLTFSAPGTFTIRATAPNAVRSEPHTICVHNGDDGNCGTPAPPGTTPPPATPTTTTTTTTPTTPTACVHAGEDGLCGTADKTPPRGLLSIAEGALFTHGRGPRLITGRVNPDPSGVPKVLMRLVRVVPHGRGRCEAFDGQRRRFVTAKCAVARAKSFTAGSGAIFTYLLPTRLTTGRYTVAMEAIDGAGNRDAPAPGRNEIVFRVR